VVLTITRIERSFDFLEAVVMKMLTGAVLALGLLWGATASAQLSVAGVRYEETVDVRGSKLVLNGAGIRHKGPFKVYAAGLYLPRKAGTPEDILAAAGAKRVSLTFLRRIDAGEFGRLFIRSVEDNMDKAAFSKLIPGLMRMSQLFTEHKELQAGDTVLIDWQPGQGTVISVKGVPQGEPFKEPEFFNALLRIWLGPAPADWQLKDALLGRQG
jgi:hypothetical protein